MRLVDGERVAPPVLQVGQHGSLYTGGISDLLDRPSLDLADVADPLNKLSCRYDLWHNVTIAYKQPGSVHVEYVPDRRGTGRFLRESHAIHAIVEGAAERGAEFLRGIAPTDTGAYREHISVEVDRDLLAGDRQAAFIVVDVPHAAAVEFPRSRGGKPQQGGSRPLARTLGFIEAGG